MDYLKQKHQDQSAYGQISDLLNKLFLERPPQRRVYSEFEALTSQLQDIKLPEGSRLPTEREKTLNQFQELQFNPQKAVSAEKEEEEEDKKGEEQAEEGDQDENFQGVDADDLQQLSKVLRQMGIKFTQIDAFRLQKAIYDLAKREEKTEGIKLFGKVGPYWVLWSTGEKKEEEEEKQEEEQDDNQGEGGEEEPEKEEKDDELIQLEEQWNEIQNQMKENKEGVEGEEPKPEGEAPPEPEKKPEDEGDDAPDMGGLEEPKKEDAPAEDAPAEGEAKEEIKSNVSFEDELKPETAVPRRVNMYHGVKYPKKRIQKIPDEEASGINKYAFYAALDVQLEELNEELYIRLQAEYQKMLFRKKNNLKQAKTKFSKTINNLLKAPLFFVPLPNLKPDEVRAFMQMPYQNIQFTGDLTYKLECGLPPFAATEATLVRCCCAKIMHQYTIVPKGMFPKEAEEEKEEEKKKSEQQQQAEKQEIKKRFELLKRTSQQKMYEVMIHNQKLYEYKEDETKPELTAAMPELETANEFKGIENYKTLLKYNSWVYMYPRINGQGRVVEVGDEDYDGIADPEPCEFKVEEEKIARKKRAKQQKLDETKKKREEIIAQKKSELKKKQFKRWMEAFQEKCNQEDEANRGEDEEQEVQVKEDEVEEGVIDKLEITAESTYEEMMKYYNSKLWRKLRQFKRPVAPWDAPIVDNRVNIAQPDLFIQEGQLDKTRVDFKQKCTYNVDEVLLQNEVDYNITKLQLWRFLPIRLQQLSQSQQVIVALNSRCTGAINIVYGLKYNKHQFVYFGNGVDKLQVEEAVMMLPDMCENPYDILEEEDVNPELQRMQHELKEDKKKWAAEAKQRAATENPDEKKEE